MAIWASSHATVGGVDEMLSAVVSTFAAWRLCDRPVNTHELTSSVEGDRVCPFLCSIDGRRGAQS